MRRYWHPISTTFDLNQNPVRPVRLLGEDLVLYRDEAGKIGLVAQRCAHRGISLAYGIPQENGLRCAYHGWLFAETGQCLEQPYEETEDPDARFNAYQQTFGDAVELIVLDSSKDNPDGYKKSAHPLLTLEVREDPPNSALAARARVVEFLREHVAGSG